MYILTVSLLKPDPESPPYNLSLFYPLATNLLKKSVNYPADIFKVYSLKTKY